MVVNSSNNYLKFYTDKKDLVFNYEYNFRIRKGFGGRKDTLQKKCAFKFFGQGYAIKTLNKLMILP